MAGYSGTPLAKKLGIKEGFKISLINYPDHYFDLFTDFPSDVEIVKSNSKPDLIHYFAREEKQLIKDIRKLRDKFSKTE